MSCRRFKLSNMLCRNGFICAMILFATVFIQLAEADPVIEVKPFEIVLGITDYLEINCSLGKDSIPNMAALVSLFISRGNGSSQGSIELAGVSEFSPTTVALQTPENTTAEGVLDQNGESYLRLTWELPTARQGGVYLCAAQGFDTSGHIVVSNSVMQVTVNEANFKDYQDKIADMRLYIKALEETVSEMNNDTRNQKTVIEEMTNYTRSLEDQIWEKANHTASLESITESCQQRLSDLENYTKSLEEPILTCLSENLDSSYLNYEGHRYYISKEGFSDIDATIVTCKLCGGYLVEIDDARELEAIQIYLTNNHTGFDYVTISGSDKVTEDVWVLQSTGEALPYEDWGPGRPATGNNGADCLFLYSTYQWRMYDFVCHYVTPRADYRYMCETPDF